MRDKLVLEYWRYLWSEIATADKYIFYVFFKATIIKPLSDFIRPAI
ncbi:hypothetical protein D1AOALGA4SA_1322 [Olavius algarvensis Delta 1 endosymbiont]|nr:hypothetical protein D1AOALGA4SA_1322 [Olavius algarvensis Delta 1 endosymbiont]